MFRVLIVDDEPFVQESLKATIPWATQNCVVVGCAPSAAKALRMMSEVHPDIVFTDIRMPGMSGLELTERLHALEPNVPVIIMTGHADFEYARTALKVGAFRYCLKPFTEEEILPVLREACEFRAKSRLVGRHESAQGIETLRQSGLLPQQGRPIQLVVLVSKATVDPPAEWELVSWPLDRRARLYALRNVSVVALHRWLDHLPAAVHGFATAENVREPDKLESIIKALRIRAYHWFMEEGGDANKLEEGTKRQEMTAQVVRELQHGEWMASVNHLAELRNLLYGTHSTIEEFRSILTTVHGALNSLIPGEPAADTFLDFDSLAERYPSSAQAWAALELRVQSNSRAVAMATLPNGGNVHIESIVTFLRLRFSQPISLADIAQHCGLSESYVSASFKRQTGQNVMTFLNQLRVEQAARLLLETTYSLEDIAERVGFSSYFYFCRVFKNSTSLPPARFRKERIAAGR